MIEQSINGTIQPQSCQALYYCFPIPKRELGGLNREVLDILLLMHSSVVASQDSAKACTPLCGQNLYRIGCMPSVQVDFFRCSMSTFFTLQPSSLSFECLPKYWRQGKWPFSPFHFPGYHIL